MNELTCSEHSIRIRRSKKRITGIVCNSGMVCNSGIVCNSGVQRPGSNENNFRIIPYQESLINTGLEILV